MERLHPFGFYLVKLNFTTYAQARNHTSQSKTHRACTTMAAAAAAVAVATIVDFRRTMEVHVDFRRTMEVLVDFHRTTELPVDFHRTREVLVDFRHTLKEERIAADCIDCCAVASAAAVPPTVVPAHRIVRNAVTSAASAVAAEVDLPNGLVDFLPVAVSSASLSSSPCALSACRAICAANAAVPGTFA